MDGFQENQNKSEQLSLRATLKTFQDDKWVLKTSEADSELQLIQVSFDIQQQKRLKYVKEVTVFPRKIDWPIVQMHLVVHQCMGIMKVSLNILSFSYRKEALIVVDTNIKLLMQTKGTWLFTSEVIP